MDIAAIIHNYPTSLITIIVFTSGIFFWCFKRIIKHMDISSMVMSQKVDGLTSKIDTINAKIDDMNLQKLDRSEYKESIKRVFMRIDETEQQSIEISNRITDLEWHTGMKKMVPVKERRPSVSEEELEKMASAGLREEIRHAE